jgi:hypothetical protein
MIYPYDSNQFNEEVFQTLQIAKEHKILRRKNPKEAEEFFDPMTLERVLNSKFPKYEKFQEEAKIIWEEFTIGTK